MNSKFCQLTALIIESVEKFTKMQKEENFEFTKVIEKKENFPSRFQKDEQIEESFVSKSEKEELIKSYFCVICSGEGDYFEAVQKLIEFDDFFLADEELLNGVVNKIFNFDELTVCFAGMDLLKAIFKVRNDLKQMFVSERIGERRIDELDEIIDVLDYTESITEENTQYFISFVEMMPEAIDMLHAHAVIDAIFTIYEVSSETSTEEQANYMRLTAAALKAITNAEKQHNIIFSIIDNFIDYKYSVALIVEYIEILFICFDLDTNLSLQVFFSGINYDIALGCFENCPDEGKNAIAELIATVAELLFAKQHKGIKKTNFEVIYRQFYDRYPFEWITNHYGDAPNESKTMFHKAVLFMTIDNNARLIEAFSSGYYEKIIEDYDSCSYSMKIEMMRSLVPLTNCLTNDDILDFIISNNVLNKMIEDLSQTVYADFALASSYNTFVFLRDTSNPRLPELIEGTFDESTIPLIEDISTDTKSSKEAIEYANNLLEIVHADD